MNTIAASKEQRVIQVFVFLCVLGYLCGWLVPLMEVDAVQYANISREMLQSKHFLQVFDQGKDYLDKPPMLFWLSSLSMYFFGINDMAYRLPSYLFAILSIYSTYRFAILYYQKQIALLSALVLASCQAMFLITHDVRTDTMLMGWVMLGIWQLAEWYKSGKWSNIILAAIAIAGGLMTKGPIALMVPVFAFAPHFILQRTFKQLFRWQYLVFLIVIGILLIPMSIGLYQQFDLHPEKVLYDKQGTSGLRFFYWTQSFGRITGESTWHENGNFFFLFQNLLWGFLPWVVFFVIGLVTEITHIIKKRFKIGEGEEWISAGGFLITYCALGVSKYQLPHYIYVVLPLAAIITGKCIYQFLYTPTYERWRKTLFTFHAVIFSLMGLVLLALLYFPFPPVNAVLIIGCVVCIILIVMALVKKWIPVPPLITLSVLTILLVNIFVDTGFYPSLLQYQLGYKAATIINQQHLDKDRIFLYKTNEQRSMAFYTNHSYTQIQNLDSLPHHDYILTEKNGFDSLGKNNFKTLYEGKSFHVSLLDLIFLNPSTRYKSTKPYYILEKE
jgi:4-amino-4-deoxy-L-arabinose transferase-like glycosyltransferase